MWPQSTATTRLSGTPSVADSPARESSYLPVPAGGSIDAHHRDEAVNGRSRPYLQHYFQNANYHEGTYTSLVLARQHITGQSSMEPVEPIMFELPDAEAIYDYDEGKFFLAKGTGTVEFWKLTQLVSMSDHPRFGPAITTSVSFLSKDSSTHNQRTRCHGKHALS